MTDQTAGHLIAQDLRLAYRSPGQRDLQVILAVDRLEIQASDHVAITGPSGAGKTSLLYVLTGIQPPSSGTVKWDDTDLTQLGESARDRWRRRNVGFVFQDFHLVPGMDVLQNVLLPSSFSRLRPAAETVEHAKRLLERLGAPPGDRPVETLSRGEQQRVALARALAHRPKIIVADEPTASLDAENGAKIRDLLFGSAAEFGVTLIVVSHDPRLLSAAGKVIWLQNGQVSAPPTSLSLAAVAD